MLEQRILVEICKDLNQLNLLSESSQTIKTKELAILAIKLSLIQEQADKLNYISLEQDAFWDEIEIRLLKTIDYLHNKPQPELNNLQNLLVLARIIVITIKLKQSKAKIPDFKIKKIVKTLELTCQTNLLLANLLIALSSLKNKYPLITRLVSTRGSYVTNNYRTVSYRLINFYADNFWRDLLEQNLLQWPKKPIQNIKLNSIKPMCVIDNKTENNHMIEIDHKINMDDKIAINDNNEIDSKVVVINEENNKEECNNNIVENKDAGLINKINLPVINNDNLANCIKENNVAPNTGLIIEELNLPCQQLMVLYQAREDFVFMPILSSILGFPAKGRIDSIQRLNAIYSAQYYAMNNMTFNPPLIPINTLMYYHSNQHSNLVYNDYYNYNSQCQSLSYF